MEELAYIKIEGNGGVGRASVPKHLLDSFMGDGWQVITKEEYLQLEMESLGKSLAEVREGGGYYFVNPKGQIFDMTDEVNAAFAAMEEKIMSEPTTGGLVWGRCKYCGGTNGTLGVEATTGQVYHINSSECSGQKGDDVLTLVAGSTQGWTGQVITVVSGGPMSASARQHALKEIIGDKPVGTTFVWLEGGELRDVTAQLEEERNRADHIFDLLCEAHEEWLRDTDPELVARIEAATGIAFCAWCDGRLNPAHIVHDEMKFCDEECVSEYLLEWDE